MFIPGLSQVNPVYAKLSWLIPWLTLEYLSHFYVPGITNVYPWDIPNYVCLSLVYPYIYFFLQKCRRRSTGWLARVPHIRRRPSSTSNTNHGVGEPFVQLLWFLGCTLETYQWVSSQPWAWRWTQVYVSYPSHKQECPSRNQGEYKWPNATGEWWV